MPSASRLSESRARPAGRAMSPAARCSTAGHGCRRTRSRRLPARLGHGSFRDRLHHPGREPIAGMIFFTRCCGSPAMLTALLRLLRPRAIERSRRGMCHALASNCNSASFARPASADAFTAALSTRPPSTATPIATRRSALARGTRRIATRRPLPAMVSGPSDKVLEHQVAQEPEQEDQDYWRDVEAAEIREYPSYRAEQWFGYPPEKIPDCGNRTIVAVDDTESDEPAQNRLSDQQPDVDRDHRVDEVEERIHLTDGPDGEWRTDPSVSRRCPQGLGGTWRGPRLTGSGAITIVRRPCERRQTRWGRSSAGRASRSQCEGQGFDPPRLHHLNQQLNNPFQLSERRTSYPISNRDRRKLAGNDNGCAVAVNRGIHGGVRRK